MDGRKRGSILSPENPTGNIEDQKQNQNETNEVHDHVKDKLKDQCRYQNIQRKRFLHQEIQEERPHLLVEHQRGLQ